MFTQPWTIFFKPKRIKSPTICGQILGGVWNESLSWERNWDSCRSFRLLNWYLPASHLRQQRRLHRAINALRFGTACLTVRYSEGTAFDLLSSKLNLSIRVWVIKAMASPYLPDQQSHWHTRQFLNSRHVRRSKTLALWLLAIRCIPTEKGWDCSKPGRAAD